MKLFIAMLVTTITAVVRGFSMISSPSYTTTFRIPMIATTTATHRCIQHQAKISLMYLSRIQLRSVTSSTSVDISMIEEDCDIVIFGGGFGGLYTALAIHKLQQQQEAGMIENSSSRRIRVSRQKPYNIVLVEPSEQFVFLPLLYDLTVGTATEQEVCPSYNDLLQGTNIRHIRASFESIEVLNNEKNNRNIVASIRPVDGRIDGTPTKLRMKAGIIAVGSTPNPILDIVPGAKQLVQPFYTANDAKRTRRLLNQIDEQQQRFNDSRKGYRPRIAIIGGGYGGVELSASIKRRIPDAHVQLLSRGRPMANTRVEQLIDDALSKLGVIIEPCNVLSFTESHLDENKETMSANKSLPKVCIKRSKWGDSNDETILVNEDELPWDAVLWTAGSTPADPVSNSGCDILTKTVSGRIAIDPTLRCVSVCTTNTTATIDSKSPKIWALGDCAEIVTFSSDGKVLPKTAQVAMQQADVVAANVLLQLQCDENIVTDAIPEAKTFIYQDLGSMLTLGGPNAAVMAPKDDTTFGPIFAPLLNAADTAFGLTDKALNSVGTTRIVEQLGVPTLESYGLSLGSYGLGASSSSAPKGILAGTIAGAARRAVYAIRMPTQQQRIVALLSATVSTASALIKESQDRSNK